ncbi:MAG TPA: hypothetical protein VHN39_10990 [Phenylobacterium sp.]|jgi:hypothetical protein|nr:hypothetical protein [Phenylobacterium sp.]
MNQTEIAVTLLSFIYVVALTHVLQCFRDLWITRERVLPSASLLAWMTAMLLFAIVTWFPLASANGVVLSGWRLGARLLFAIGVYFCCAFVSPSVPDEGVLDLKNYESRNGAGFKLTFLALAALSIPMNSDLHKPGGLPAVEVPAFLLSQWFVAVSALITLLSLWRRERWVRTICGLSLATLNGWVLLRNMGLLPG